LYIIKLKGYIGLKNIFCLVQCNLLNYVSSRFNLFDILKATGGPAYYVLYPQGGITICIFLTYPAFKSREGIIYQQILAE